MVWIGAERAAGVSARSICAVRVHPFVKRVLTVCAGPVPLVLALSAGLQIAWKMDDSQGRSAA